MVNQRATKKDPPKGTMAKGYRPAVKSSESTQSVKDDVNPDVEVGSKRKTRSDQGVKLLSGDSISNRPSKTMTLGDALLIYKKALSKKNKVKTQKYCASLVTDPDTISEASFRRYVI
jgi:hypothetical protein